MHIYIDEAGAFIEPRTKPHFSLALALIIPRTTQSELCYEFLRLRDQWRNPSIEIKGSRLNETQAAQIAALLTSHGALVEFYAVDMATHPRRVIDEIKSRQADEITAHVTPEHQPALVQELQKLADTIRRTPNQLFIQLFVTILLIFETLQTATLYFVQRLPSELGQFTWTIDRKDRSITEMEHVWTKLVLPASESRFNRSPFIRIQGADYSHFSRYEIRETTADERMLRHLEWLRITYSLKAPGELRCIDIKRLLTEARVFADSKADLGLQLADITASVFRRALNGTLMRPGWEPFGELLIRKADKGPFAQLGNPEESSIPHVDGHAAAVWRTLRNKSRSMLL